MAAEMPASPAGSAPSGATFAADFMARQGNAFNAALRETGYDDLYGGHFGSNYNQLLQRSHHAFPDSPQLKSTIDNLVALEPVDPKKMAFSYDNPGMMSRQQIASS